MTNSSVGDTSSQRFGSRIGLLLSVLGIAVGTGNIWRFPRIAAQNAGEEGSGAFLLAWLVFLLAWSIPLIIAEYGLGRIGRMGVVGTFGKIAGRKLAWMGAFVGFVATAIMFYYSVVAGWCIFYFQEMLTNPLPLTTDAAEGVWGQFQAGGWPIFFHGSAMCLGAAVVWRGVRSIERANLVLIPALFAIVIISLVRTLTLDGSFEGIRFLFGADWSTLARPRVWLEALTQNAWDTGAGWGLILTYGAYMRIRHGVVKNAVITGVGNNLISLVSAVTIFGTVFAVLGAEMSRAEVLEVMKTSGPASTGLTFIWMPQLFSRMPAGSVLAVLFFLGLAFAAFSSLIAMIELAARVLVDAGLRRSQAIGAVATVGFACGVPSAASLDILGNQDFVWGVALMISGAFVASAVLRHGARSFRVRLISGTEGDWDAGRVWEILISYVVPAEAVILLVWWLYLSAGTYAPDTWYDPFDPYSVMSCLVQWGAALAAVVLLNRRLVEATLGRDATPAA